MEQYHVFSNHCQLKVYSMNPSHSPTAILFLHGGPGSGAKALINLPVFQKLHQKFHCIYFDQRGSGHSFYDLSKGISAEDITNDVLHIVQDAKTRFAIQKLFLWGGSFGGLLASLCIQKFADIFDGVILSSPAITFSREQAIDFYQRMKKQYTSRLAHSITNNKETPEDFFSNPNVRQWIFSDANPSYSLKHICAMSNWFYRYTFEGMLKDIPFPLLVMQGKDDPICLFQNIDNEIKKTHNQNIEYYLFEECGHEVFVDKPKEFIDIIETFIRRQSLC